jgi:hypothetical protein
MFSVTFIFRFILQPFSRGELEWLLPFPSCFST